MSYIQYIKGSVQIITREVVGLVRKQFTFYYSYFDAIRDLSPQDRLSLYDALTAFALEGTEPKLTSQVQVASFKLIRPTVAAARRRAKAALKKSVDAQTTGSSKKKKKNEIEIENEIENEIEIKTETETENNWDSSLVSAAVTGCVCEENNGFDAFWESYPIQLARDKAQRAYRKLDPDPALQRQILNAVAQWKRSPRWAMEDGRFIPRAHCFLRDEYWKQKPPEAAKGPIYGSGEMGQAELEAIRRVLAEG